MFIPCCISDVLEKNQQYALIVPLLYFDVLAPTWFGSSRPSSGRLLAPPEVRATTNGGVGYQITGGYVAWGPDGRGSGCGGLHTTRNHDSLAHRPRNHTLYDIPTPPFVFSSNSGGSN
jgi:hypothetical protein